MRSPKSFNEPRLIEQAMHCIRIDELHNTISIQHYWR
jgi:hypothetical protein